MVQSPKICQKFPWTDADDETTTTTITMVNQLYLFTSVIGEKIRNM